jgi:hypothetical protein
VHQPVVQTLVRAAAIIIILKIVRKTVLKTKTPALAMQRVILVDLVFCELVQMNCFQTINQSGQNENGRNQSYGEFPTCLLRLDTPNLGGIGK